MLFNKYRTKPPVTDRYTQSHTDSDSLGQIYMTDSDSGNREDGRQGTGSREFQSGLGGD